MSAPIAITEENSRDYFSLMVLADGAPVSAFQCRIAEYADYLREDAFRAQDDHIAQTWLLRENTSGGIAAYMSLIADAVKLSNAERELHRLDYPFKTIPAINKGKRKTVSMRRDLYM